MKEIEQLLPRTQSKDLDEILGKFSSLIKSTVNLGTHLIKWDLDKKRDGGDADVPPVIFLRNLVEYLDSVSVLVRSSSIDPCKPLLRTLLENAFGLMYMLEKESERRALSYIVWNTHRNLKLLDKVDSSTQTGKQFKAELSKDKLLPDTNDFFDQPVLSGAKKNAEELLRLPKYQPIEKEYQRTVAAGNRNPNWYSLFNGPNNIEMLAKHLNHHASYEILYRDFSGKVHATRILQRRLVSNPDGTVAIVQIRYPEDAQSVTVSALNISLLSYRVYLESRVPEKMNEFNNWYSGFRTSYLALLKDNYIKMSI